MSSKTFKKAKMSIEANNGQIRKYGHRQPNKYTIREKNNREPDEQIGNRS